MAALDRRTLDMCTAIKNKRVFEIYTIAFQAEAGSAADNLMRNRATDAAHHFNATDGAQITKAFTAIGRQLRKMRLAQ